MALAPKADLRCNACGVGDLFAPVYKLSWSASLGTSQQPTGQYFCIACHGLVDQEIMVGTVKLEHKQAEMAQAEEEMRELELQKAQKKAGVPSKKELALEKDLA